MTLEERIAALESRQIVVGDLPIAQLQRRLEQRWQPDAGTLLLPGTVTRDALTQKLDYGTAVAVFDGVNPDAQIVANHALAAVPVGAVCTPVGGVVWAAVMIDAQDAATVTLTVQTLDGTAPAAATAITLNWIVYA